MIQRFFNIGLFFIFLIGLSACGDGNAEAVGRLYQAVPSNIDGNTYGDVTMVEFFDYRCGPCRRMVPSIEQAIKDNPNLRVVYRDIAVLGPESKQLALAAEAAKLQGRYLAFSRLLMTTPKPLNADSLNELAYDADLNVQQFQADMKSQEATDALAANQALAKEFGVQGTPTFFLGKTKDLRHNPKKFSGDMNAKQLNQWINKLG